MSRASTAAALLLVALLGGCGTEDESGALAVDIVPLVAGNFGPWDNAVFVVRFSIHEVAGDGLPGALLASKDFVESSDGVLALPSVSPGRRFVTVEGMTFRGADLLPFSRGRVEVELGAGAAPPAKVFVVPINGFGELPAALLEARHAHSATLLEDGRVLVAGGFGSDGARLSSAELFDPRLGAWMPVAEGLRCARGDHAALRVPGSGDVVLVGGEDEGCIERFVPRSGRFELMPYTLAVPREAHAAAIARGGDELWVLGGTELPNGAPTLSVERIQFGAGTISSMAPLDSPRVHAGIAPADGGTALLLIGGDGASAAASRVDLGSGDVAPLAPAGLPLLRGHSTFALEHSAQEVSASIVVALGEDDDGTHRGLALLRPENPSADADNLPLLLPERDGSEFAGRRGAEAIELADGSLLLVGGDTPDGVLPPGRGYLYYPSRADPDRLLDTRFPLHQGRRGHALTRLRTGAVLVTGGRVEGGAPTPRCELYAPFDP